MWERAGRWCRVRVEVKVGCGRWGESLRNVVTAGDQVIRG